MKNTLLILSFLIVQGAEAKSVISCPAGQVMVSGKCVPILMQTLGIQDSAAKVGTPIKLPTGQTLGIKDPGPAAKAVAPIKPPFGQTLGIQDPAQADKAAAAKGGPVINIPTGQTLGIAMPPK